MVVIEAAIHSTHNVAFTIGGIVHAVQDGNKSYPKCTIQFLQSELLLDERLCKNYAEQFSWYNLKTS